MTKRGCIGGLLVLAVSLLPAFAGDSLYGRVTAVKSPEVVVFEYGSAGGPGRSTARKSGQYDLRIAGIDAPGTGARAREARQFLSSLVLGKNARMRFEYRNKSGEMVARLFTDDPELGVKDVGLELVKAGMARRQASYDYKYGELSAAEREAREARRGLWSQAEPR